MSGCLIGIRKLPSPLCWRLLLVAIGDGIDDGTGRSIGKRGGGRGRRLSHGKVG